MAMSDDDPSGIVQQIPEGGDEALIDLIGELGREVYYMLDDCETSGPVGDEIHTITSESLEKVSGILDRIDALPFEEPGYILGTGAKLQAALKQTFPSSSTLVAPRNDAWRDDPASDERWNVGCDFAMTQLCSVLRVDPKSVSWDAATETLDGDVMSMIGNILTAAFGDDWLDAHRRTTEADLRAEVERLAYERGWRAAIEAAANHCWSKRHLLADAEKKQVAAGLTGRDYYGRRLEAELLSRTIRALSPETDGGQDG